MPKYDLSFGRCFSVQLKPKVTVMGVTKVEFRAKLNIYIYLHHPGQYMDVDSKTKVMFLPFFETNRRPKLFNGRLWRYLPKKSIFWVQTKTKYLLTNK